MDDGVVAEAMAVVEIAEADAPGAAFTAAERAYAASKSDPLRRLAARLAARRALSTLLGADLAPEDAEVRPARGGPPRFGLGPRAEALLGERGATGVLVSLTHGRTHAAAAVVLLRA